MKKNVLALAFAATALLALHAKAQAVSLPVVPNAGFETSAPGAPTINSMAVGINSASLTFAELASNGSSSIIDYRATCSAPGQSSVSASAPAAPITLVGLAAGVPYASVVSARNSMGMSAASAAVIPTRLTRLKSWTQPR